MPEPRTSPRRFSRWLISHLWPNQRLRLTREGWRYLVIWLGLLAFGLYQQINLILLVAGLAAGPIASSIVVSAAMLRRLRVGRRAPKYAFAGEPLAIDYTLDNDRRMSAALALVVADELVPADRSSGATGVGPLVFFPRVAGLSRMRARWQGIAPARGRYRFRNLEIVTRSPFGLLERELSIPDPGDLVVYPTIGQLARRWQYKHLEASEARRGSRSDRSIQQQEYHGLRDYRPGDSPRWIHWRTTARLGVPMVKEFEQHNEQDLAILLDPWLPRNKATAEQREAVELAIRFVATICYETCRHPGRRLLMGWAGPTPGVRQGPASVKLLHEFLEQLATLRPLPEGGLADLLDILPPATLRDSFLIVVSTRPIQLAEEAERSTKLSATSIRGLMGRVTLLDASRGDLAPLIHFGPPGSSPAALRDAQRRTDDGDRPEGAADPAGVASAGGAS
ncbi:DUF58 domain-containing protein [Tundrisphaera sp. TA3]|uniref:DUF58 domain-containing protein n=1 Tax=Tundrisphaera sp. TA3 TaxID=3435775 RepID=UPI003EB76F9E